MKKKVFAVNIIQQYLNPATGEIKKVETTSTFDALIDAEVFADQLITGCTAVSPTEGLKIQMVHLPYWPSPWVEISKLVDVCER